MALTIQSFMPSDAECAGALREVRWAAGFYASTAAAGLLSGVVGGSASTSGTAARIVDAGSTTGPALS